MSAVVLLHGMNRHRANRIRSRLSRPTSGGPNNNIWIPIAFILFMLAIIGFAVYLL
jgi:hypothetical protein